MACEASAFPITDLYSLSKSEAYSIIHKHHVVDPLKEIELEIFGKKEETKEGGISRVQKLGQM